MQVAISTGLTGWRWDRNGNRMVATKLTNPFWIADNSLLRAFGLKALEGSRTTGKLTPAASVTPVRRVGSIDVGLAPTEEPKHSIQEMF